MKKNLFFSLVLGLLGFCLNVQAQISGEIGGQYETKSQWTYEDGTLTFNAKVAGHLKSFCDTTTLKSDITTVIVKNGANDDGTIAGSIVTVADINALAACTNMEKLYIYAGTNWSGINNDANSTISFSGNEKLFAFVMYGKIGCNIDVSNCKNLDRLMFLNSTLSGNAVTSNVKGCTNLRFIVEPYGFTGDLGITTTENPNLYCVLYANDASTQLDGKQSTLVEAGITSGKYDILKFVCYRSNFPDDMVNLVNAMEPKYFAVKFEYADGITSETAAFTPNDVTHLNTINSDYFDYADIDFSKETYAQLNSGKLAMTNEHVKYGILPHGLKYIHMNLFNQCDSLRSVISITDDANGNPRKLAAYVKVPGSLYYCIFLAEEVANQWAYNTSAANVDSVNICGHILACDIAIGTDNINAAGHYELGANGTIKAAFSGASSIEHLDLGAANFEDANGTVYCSDMTLSKIGYGTSLKSLVFPFSHKMDTIPANACVTFSGLTEICIPGNIRVIGDNAFYDNNGLIHYYTTEFIEGMGADTSKVIDNGQKTLTFPARLTHVGKGAFGGDNLLTDVYVTSTDQVPTCDKDAFDKGSYVGFGGYNSAAPVTRSSYTNGNHQFAVLHYPSGIGEEKEKLYTDITKKYTIADGLMTTDGNGELLYWPNQSEYNRVYNQACSGYIWGDWKEYDASGALYSDSTDVKNANAILQSDKTQNKFYSNYIGWHQFVLAAAKNYKSDKPQYDFSRFKKSQWYSICLPFNLTKSDLMRIFGDGTNYPDVRTLQCVELNDTTRYITLMFCKDNLADNSGNHTWDFSLDKDSYTGDTHYKKYPTTDDGEQIVIEAGKPYMIWPYLPDTAKASAAAGTRVLDVTLDAEADAEYSVVLPYRDYRVRPYRVKDRNTKELAMKDYYYGFFGTFRNDTLPQYSIYIAGNKWYRYTGTAYKKWGAYTAIIGAKPMVTVYAGENVDIHFEYVDGLLYSDPADTKTTRSYTMNGAFSESNDELTLTGIGTIQQGNIIYQIPATDGIYDLQGRKRNSLQKGVNIVDGKKIVVK